MYMLRTVIYEVDCITVLLNIIDCYLIIVKVNLKARGFTDSTSLTLPLQIHKLFNLLISIPIFATLKIN